MFALHEPLDDVVRTELNSYDDLIAALLSRRGITTQSDAEQFLNPSYDNHLHDPMLMTDMPKAAARLAKAIRENEKIAIWSDYDCDGVPGAVVLHDFLKKAGAPFENYIPHRHLEGYGVNINGINKLAKQGIQLIVTVDSGITDLEPIARAQELGMDVIVTDHHLPRLAEASGGGGPKETLPDAFAVVNPNARADESYPFHELCGSGIAWKLVCATLAVEPKLRELVGEGWEKWLLDMVGLATIADMVPLVGENRVLATYGLLVMRKSPRLGLQKLCRVMRTNQRFITEDDVGFMLAPRVNAASRMDDAMDAFRLFTTNDENEADALAKKLESANRQRKAEAGTITRAVRTRLKERAVRSVIALGDPSWRPALLGLVASGIADEYERPVFLWGREGLPALPTGQAGGRQGTGKLKGSVRSGGVVNAVELMQATEETFAEFGGHAAAGGFTVLDTAVFYLEDKLVEAHEKISKNAEIANDLSSHADAVITPEEVHISFLKSIEKLAPFGVKNPKPIFLFKKVVLQNVLKFGKSEEHIKIKIASNENGVKTLEAVLFFARGALARTLHALTPGTPVNLLAHIERDTFSRTNPVRLRLLNLKLV